MAGIAEIATNAEALAGASDTVVLSPLKLQYVLDNKSATTTAKGVVELATNAEVQAGVDTLRAITAAGLFSFPETTGTGEWSFQIPGTAVIVKIGTGAVGSGHGTTFTFATPFPTRCRAVFKETISTVDYGEGNELHVKDVTASSFKVTHNGSATFPSLYWLAIGE